ncbi:hypothetical protein [Cronobacter sakazakii]|nr:hypothetical protein [Cronobacter sakazakii]
MLTLFLLLAGCAKSVGVNRSETAGQNPRLSIAKDAPQPIKAKIVREERPVEGLEDAFKGAQYANFRSAFKKLHFFTTDPDKQTLQSVYVKVGGYNLTLNQIIISIKEQIDECKRVSAYTGENIEQACIDRVGSGLTLFAVMLDDPGTPGTTKKAALGEATINRVVYFEHAARLAKMHNAMCEKQNNYGYAKMVTISVPCSGFKGVGM